MKSITKKAIIIKGKVIKSSHIPMDTNKKRWMGIKIQVANSYELNFNFVHLRQLFAVNLASDMVFRMV